MNRPATVSAGDIQTARILIIDDEAAIRESLEVLLSSRATRSSMARGRRAGPTQLERENYDLVLLDLALPGESGLDLLPQIWSGSRNCPSS